MPQTIGIYKLIKDGEVVYIGQSVNCEKRINEHQSRGKKEFDSYQVIMCNEDELDKLEKEKIEEYQPKYNKEKKDNFVITKKEKAPENRKLEGVYLDDVDREIISNIQEKTGRDKSEIVRKALRFLDENVTIK